MRPENTDRTPGLETLKRLMALDQAALEAYDAALNRLNDGPAEQQLTVFRAAHERHLQELARVVSELGGQPDAGATLPAQLRHPEAELQQLSGDNAVLRALLTNAEQVALAYDRALATVPAAANEIVRRARNDQRHHWEWLASALSGKPVAYPER